MKKPFQTMLQLSGLAFCALLCVNCTGGVSAAPGTSNENNDPNSCTSTQLADMENDILATLATVSTDADFSFAIDTEDGRSLRYDRGASTMTSVYQSASTSKWVAATIILSFMESSANQNSSKRLTLNSHPQDFLNSTIWPISPSDPLYNMTLRQLLSFTSGMTHQAECVHEGGTGATMDFFDCITEIANDNKDLGLIPGALFDYNSDHLQVAGAMAIKARDVALGVSNSDWQDLFNEFKTKTGLFANSTFRAPSPKNPRLAGGMQWTGDDYVAFLKAIYNNQILSSLTMPGETAPYRVQQYQDQMATVGIGNSPAKTTIKEDWHYGFGNWLQCHSKNFDCGPGSGKEVSAWASPGSLGAFPFLDRGHRFWGIIAREGNLATFSKGYAVYMSVGDLVNKWAIKDCSAL